MDDQLLLPEMPGANPVLNRLFIGLFPDEATARRIVEFAGPFRDRHKLTGKLRPLHHLHVTLHHLGDYPDLPVNVIEAAKRMCQAAAAETEPFEVEFDRVISFAGRPGHLPLVLVDHEGNTALREFHGRLLARPSKQEFRPHVTLLYDRQRIREEPVSGVSWIAREVVLIRSLVGRTEYRELGRWAFGG